MSAKSGRGSRDLKVRLRSQKGRTSASKRWLERQLNDPYVARAKREGLRSRAAFKLAEIDDKFRLFKPGAKVVDLGAAPGGWSQIAAQRVEATPSPLVGEGRGGGSSQFGATAPGGPTPTPDPSPQGGGEEFAERSGRKPASVSGRVVAIDLIDMPAIPGVEFLHLDFLDTAAPDRLKALLGALADVVLSDMAANATGHRKTDHLKIMALAEAAAMFARDVLRPGGTFLCKVLQGGTEGELLAGLKRDFATVKHVKPAASRSDSAELYVLALGFRGRPDEYEKKA
ncbi:MAG TPA: RlmE family RNA methyltransferase [Xanthobacteraceae bacterium]|nr:RlmE family RNA methyltransferase [Xanthobacteraceae bacterium]